MTSSEVPEVGPDPDAIVAIAVLVGMVAVLVGFGTTMLLYLGFSPGVAFGASVVWIVAVVVAMSPGGSS